MGFVLSCGRDGIDVNQAPHVGFLDLIQGRDIKEIWVENWFMSDLVSSWTLRRKAEISLKRTPAVLESYCRSAAACNTPNRMTAKNALCHHSQLATAMLGAEG